MSDTGISTHLHTHKQPSISFIHQTLTLAFPPGRSIGKNSHKNNCLSFSYANVDIYYATQISALQVESKLIFSPALLVVHLYCDAFTPFVYYTHTTHTNTQSVFSIYFEFLLIFKDAPLNTSYCSDNMNT